MLNFGLVEMHIPVAMRLRPITHYVQFMPAESKRAGWLTKPPPSFIILINVRRRARRVRPALDEEH